MVVREEKGQAAVELALTLPLLLLILFALVEFGRVFFAYLVITNAAREGARLAAVGGSDVAIVDRVKDAAAGLEQGKLQVEVSPSAPDRVSGTTAVVKVSYPVNLLLPLPPGVLPNPVVLKAQASMRVE
ncbi:TadE family protein [Ammonifex degensii KC4]|uniref:TadE family protein n=1 Tax=Ammonifex degensii (strain DSM 10501 / KC4) TaxID=429009 RepID=C9RD43_AMMDK|nr:TadE/TadG family type IV pilus assembly protein [Ammonifex degensii]ACX52170.1 TadE family protein [Ammonifex degensii KC4]